MSAYRMTPARRAALKKAQLASARKRRGKGRGKLAHANRTIDRSRRRNGRIKKAAKIAGTAAAVGAVAYGAHKGAQIHKRKNAAIHQAKSIQRRNRTRYKLAKRHAAANPGDRKAQTRLKVHRRNLRISSTRSVHKAIIKQHTGR